VTTRTGPPARSAGGTRRLALSATILACAAFAVGCGGGSAGSGVPRAFYGIVPSEPLMPQDFARMGNANVGSLRFQVYWPSIQASSAGGYDWGTTDPTVADAARQRIDLLPILTGKPSWLGACPTCTGKIEIAAAAEREAWKRFVIAAVRRYGPNGSFWRENTNLPPDPITRWQIWNEQNNPVEGNPAATYARLLALSKQAIQSVDPRGEIVLGGMFGTPKGFRRPGVTAWSYLKLLYRAGARKDFDAVALHPYSPTLAGLRYQIRKVRAIMRANHDARTPILITELGWGSGAGTHHARTGSRGEAFVVTPAQQARKLTASFKLLTSRRASWGIGGVFWFSWRDPANPPPGLCAFCYSSGLYDANGTTPKPSLAAFERFTHAAES
jgi:polysaccharide biosynthesis protein PslG